MCLKNKSINTRHNLIPLVLHRQFISFLMDWHLLINDTSHMSERKAHDKMLIDYTVLIISGFFSGKKGDQHHDEVICTEAFFLLRFGYLAWTWCQLWTPAKFKVTEILIFKIFVFHGDYNCTRGKIKHPWNYFSSRIAVNLDFLLVLERTFSSNLHRFQFCPQAAGASREIK